MLNKPQDVIVAIWDKKRKDCEAISTKKVTNIKSELKGFYI